MHIESIPMCKISLIEEQINAMNTRLNFAFWIGVGTSNNYAYLVVDEHSKDAVIIDPANPPEYGLFLLLQEL